VKYDFKFHSKHFVYNKNEDGSNKDIYIYVYTGCPGGNVLIVLSPTRKETSYSDRRF